MRLESIPKDQVHLLASILQQPPSEPWIRYAERVYCIEAQLDRNVLRPDFLHRLIQLPQSHYAPLCGLHKILNAKIVHQVFVLLATEVGLRLNSIVVAGRDKVGHETWDCSILNLRSLHAAWLDPEVFWDTFGHTLDVPPNGHSQDDYMTKWLPEEHKCEACILARIGGDLDTIFDLLMVVKSRIHSRAQRKYHEPRLMNVLTGWLEMWELRYAANEWRAKLEWNELRARRLKDARRQIAKEKRKDRGKRSKSHQRPQITAPLVTHQPRLPATSQDKSIPRPQPHETAHIYRTAQGSKFEEDLETANSTDDDNDGAAIRDKIQEAENELIDCYAALISTPFLPGMDDREHQKRASNLSRYSVVPTPADMAAWPMVGRVGTAEDAITRSQSTKHRRPSNYSESVYSQPSQILPAQFPAKFQAKPSSDTRRSNTIREKRTSDRSWVTASAAPSAVDSHASVSKHDKRKRQPRTDQVFDPISEEPPTPQRTGSRENPISPLGDHSYTAERSNLDSTGRSGRDSPVSPISVEDSFDIPQSSGGNRAQNTARDRHKLYQEAMRSPVANMKILGSLNESRPDAVRSKIGPRLSRPFDGPATLTEPGTLASSVKQLRQQSPPRRSRSDKHSSRTDTTDWSDLYRGGIQQVEERFRAMELNSRSGSRHSRRGGESRSR